MGRKTHGETELLPGMEESPREAAHRPSPKRRIRVSTARLVTLSAAALMLLALSLYVFQMVEQFLLRDPRFALRGGPRGSERPTFEIFGAAHASLGAIESVFGEDLDRSVYSVPLDERADSLRNVAWVREASVARIWPNRLLVHVTERQPVAFVTLPAARFGLIDADGVILPPVTDRFKLPVLAGVAASDSLQQRRGAVDRMLRLLAELGEDGARVSEIDVSEPDNMIVSQPYKGRILKLMLGDRNFAVRYGNFLNHYDEIHTRLPGATVLDLRLENRITVVE